MNLLLSIVWLTLVVGGFVVLFRHRVTAWPTVDQMVTERKRLRHELRLAILRGSPERELLAIEQTHRASPD